jgi:hypothetical protein
MRLHSNTDVSDSGNSFWNNPASGLFDILLSVWRYVFNGKKESRYMTQRKLVQCHLLFMRKGEKKMR